MTWRGGSNELALWIVPEPVLQPTLERALSSLPDLASRRMVLREKILCDPASGVWEMDAIVRRAQGGTPIARDATVALGSMLIGMRHAGETTSLEALRIEAERAGLAAVAALLGDAPAHRALAPLGRLREVSLGERAFFRRWPCADGPFVTRSTIYRLRLRSGLRERFSAHPSPVFIGRLLRELWLDLEDVLQVASRRPTTPALAFELAYHDRWFQRIEVREAMVQNPFTPTGLVLSLLPSTRRRLLAHLRDAGDAHPLVSSAAGELIALGR